MVQWLEVSGASPVGEIWSKRLTKALRHDALLLLLQDWAGRARGWVRAGMARKMFVKVVVKNSIMVHRGVVPMTVFFNRLR